MKELIITEREEGQRLDRFLQKYLKNAQTSFLYKMMRKKNITLNDKKASGSEKLKKEDIIKIWFSDETLDKMGGAAEKHAENEFPYKPLDIIYEDDHIVLINKEVGMLSQKAEDKDRSLVEYLIGYLLHSGQISEETLKTFRPSICNRLDRNTSGIVVCGKTIAGLQEMSDLLRERSMHKYYRCVVAGEVKDTVRADGYLIKDEKSNKVTILQEHVQGAQRIITEYTPVSSGYASLGEGKKRIPVTELEVLLVTGRSHQIRAHLASLGHPLLGDQKYGRRELNERVRQAFGIKAQMLHAYRLEMPEIEGQLSYLSHKKFTASLPETFSRLQRAVGTENR